MATDDRRDLVVRADSQELRFDLLADANMYRVNLVPRPGFLEHDVDLVPVGRGPRIDFDHRCSFRVQGLVPAFGKQRRLARPAGVEPTTPSLEGWCSIQFELRARLRLRLRLRHCGPPGGGPSARA